MSEASEQPIINPQILRKVRARPDVEKLLEGLLAGDRYVLSKAITLVESTAERDRVPAVQLLSRIMPYTGKSERIGISGSPGVGKSTFIEAYGQRLTGKGKKLAVLTVDPSSQQSKGSILGDKTRMENLSRETSVLIRPSPSGNRFGGVAGQTRAAVLLCEAAGYNHIIIETVGVGQSETEVHRMVDLFILLIMPGGGDELQGIKRGIMELADIIAVNQSDGSRLTEARTTRKAYAGALQLMQPSRPFWKPAVINMSALEGTGFDELDGLTEQFFTALKQGDHLDHLRRSQSLYWMHELIRQSIQQQFYRHPDVVRQMQQIEEKVSGGSLSSHEGAARLLELYGYTEG